MAIQALAIFRGLMLRFGGLRERIMAVRAESFAHLLQHLGIGVAMRVVARSAFAVLGGLVFAFCLFEEIIMATETNLLLTPFHLHRKSRFMTLVALLVFVRRVCGEMLFGKGGNGALHRLSFVQRTPILIVNDSRRIGLPARPRDSVKKEIQPFLLRLRGATRQNSQAAEHREKTF